MTGAPPPIMMQMAGDDPGPGARIEVVLARLEGKVDVALAYQSAKLDEHSRRLDATEARLARVEERPVTDPADVTDHETRLRIVERTPTVSPRAMWTGVGVVATVVAALVPLAQQLYTH